MPKKLLIYAGYIIVCTTVLIGIFSPKPLVDFKGHGDLYFHFATMLIFTVWSRVVFIRTDWLIFAAILLPVVLLLEPIQGLLLPTRVFSILDLAANIVGCLVGLLICFFFLKKRRFTIN